jgi:toxoflavin synthase
MKKNGAEYDAISSKYTELVKTDPQKIFVQYPSALKLLGNVSGLNVLDVGCGSGALAQELSSRGASVVGYDISAEQIANAKKLETNIEFLVSDPRYFKTEKKFDKAVSVLVLHYAKDQEHLKDFFLSTFRTLKDNGEFVCILSNPELKRLGVNLYNRQFRKIGNGKMIVDFLDKNHEVSCSAEYSDFLKEDYREATTKAGFKKIEWIALKPTDAGVKEMGEEYWQGFKEDCPYVGLIAYKK